MSYQHGEGLNGARWSNCYALPRSILDYPVRLSVTQGPDDYATVCLTDEQAAALAARLLAVANANAGKEVSVDTETCRACPATRTIYTHWDGTIGVSESDAIQSPCQLEGPSHWWPQ